MKDFFISYNFADKSWAEWIALTLEAAGYTLTLQAWDMQPGSNFVVEMQKATIECERTIAVLSPDWLAALFTQPEWTVAFSLDPTGSAKRLVPVRVQACEPPGMLRAIVYCDLVGLDEESARKMLLRGVAKTPFRPDFVVFPGATAKAKQGFERNSQQEYPGAGSSVVPDQLQDLSRSAFSIFSLLQTTRTTFDAQARLRNTLVKHVHQRLVLDPFRKWEYEPFIAFYYPDLDDEERRMFSTMRSFTSNILRDYNRQILALIGETPDLVIRIPRIADLRSHLVVWLAKYEGTFVNTPQMCLLYTGVEEGVPFPHGIESELLRFLQEGPGSPRLATPESHIAEEGSSSNDLHWRLPLEKKFVKRRIQEIIRERQNAQSRAAPGTDVAVLEQLKALDIELAGLVARRMYPQMMWRPIAVPDSLLIGVRELLKLPDRDLPEEFRAALAKTSTVAETVNSSPLHLKLFVSQLPTLAFYAGVLGQGELPSEWERFRDQLSSWTMAEND